MKRIIFIALLLSVTIRVSGQQVSGTVLDNATKSPVAGASVKWKASGVMTATGENGRYTLSFTGIDTLLVSALGYRDEKIYVRSADTFDVEMTPSSSLIDGIEINTGYYRISPERASGSFSLIGNEDLNRNPSPNLIQRLEGLSPGLQFVNSNGTSKEDIRVRGLSTIESDASPLVILDNFPYEGDIDNLDPNDIESVSVLKDAAASSIWGARAGNGVIVITTKKGKRDGRVTVSFNQVQSWAEKPDFTYGRSYLPSPIIMDIEKSRYETNGYNFEDGLAVPLYVDFLKMAEEGQISPDQLQMYEDRFGSTDVRQQAGKYLYTGERNGQYNLSLSGGTDRYGFHTSVGYMDRQQQEIGNGNRRMNVTFRNEFRPIESIQLEAGIAYVEQRGRNNGIGLNDLQLTTSFPVSPYYSLMEEDGPSGIVRDVRYSYAMRAEEEGLLDWVYRPLADRGLSDNRSWSKEVRLNTGASVDIWHGLSFRADYQLTRGNSGSETHHFKDSYYARDLVNRFTQANGTQIIPYNGILQVGNPGQMESHYGRAQLQYSSPFGTAHHLSALGGAEIRHAQSRTLPGSVLYNYHDEYRTGSNQYNFDQLYPTMPNGQSSRRIPAGSTMHAVATNRDISYFGNVGYTYMDRYIFNGSVRWDGSNLFGVKANQKGVPLWSTGISWDISKEPFYHFGNVLPYLRLRSTVGTAGNVNRSITHYPTIRYSNSNSFVGLTNATLLSIGNPSLRWEKVNTYNLGVDFGTAGNVIRGSVEYYRKAGSDLIGDDYMDPTTGITGDYKINYADITSKGIDILLSVDRRWKKLGWSSTVNYSFVGNRIENYRTKDNLELYHYFNEIAPPEKGNSKDIVYAIPWHGLDPGTGHPVVYMDGEQTDDYNEYYLRYLTRDMLTDVGVSVPTSYGSWRNTFRMGSMEVSAMLLWKSGSVFRRTSMGPIDEYSNIYHIDYLDRWKSPGDEKHTNVPAGAPMDEMTRYAASGSIYRQSEALIERGDHIRLRDVTLAYMAPAELAQKIGARSFSVRLHVNNIGILWKKNRAGIDPDAVNSWYTAPRSYSLSLNVIF